MSAVGTSDRAALGRNAPIAEAVAGAAGVVASDHRPRDRTLRRLLALADGGGLLLGLLLLAAISRRPPFHDVLLWGLPSLPVWLGIFASYGLYRRDQLRLGHTTIDDIPWLFHAMLLGCPLLWIYFRWLPGDEHFGPILAFGAASAAAVLVLRAATRALAGRLIRRERVLLVGDDGELALLAGKLRRNPSLGAEPVGALSRGGGGAAARPPGGAAEEAELPVLGDPSELERVAAEHAIDRVVVSHVEADRVSLLELVRRCKELSIKVSVLPQLSDAMGPAVELDDVAGLTLIAINPPVLSRSARIAKRTMDLAGVVLLAPLTAPLMLAIAIAIKLDSPGPVLFRQERVGRRGRTFTVLKFRTMSRDAAAQRDALLAASKDPDWLHLEHDPRITRVGRTLRHSSLDELPQLWNVLRGEMSLVGPRPLIPSENANLIGWARSRLDLTPGMSGLWQVLGRTSIPFAEMLKLDYLYVTNWSLWGDVRLVLRTLPALLLRRGAN